MGWNEQLRAQHQNNNGLERLVLRTCSARGRYAKTYEEHTYERSLQTAQIEHHQIK